MRRIATYLCTEPKKCPIFWFGTKSPCYFFRNIVKYLKKGIRKEEGKNERFSEMV